MGNVVGIVVLAGKSWALFLSDGELSPVGSCPRTPSTILVLDYCIRGYFCEFRESVLAKISASINGYVL